MTTRKKLPAKSDSQGNNASRFARAMARSEFGRFYVNDGDLAEVRRSMLRNSTASAETQTPQPGNGAGHTTQQQHCRTLPDDLIDTEEVSRLTTLSVAKLEAMRGYDSGLNFYKLGPGRNARVAYSRREVLEWIAMQRVACTAEHAARRRTTRQS